MRADLDAFYASVEQLLDPTLRGRPIAVGGGVVLAASYEARGYGVHAGMAGWQARKLCPDLHFVGGHYREYQRLGDQVIGVLNDFTPWVERISIDEAFLDVSGSLHLFGPAETVADIRVELPVDAHLPHEYVPGERLRLEAYRRIAEAPDDAAIDAVRDELVDRYGQLPAPVENLLSVASFRAHARAAGLTDVTLQGNLVRFGPVDLPESGVLRMQRLYPKTLFKPAVRTMLVPRPMTARVGGRPVLDVALLAWCREVVDAVLEGLHRQTADSKESS